MTFAHDDCGCDDFGGNNFQPSRFINHHDARRQIGDVLSLRCIIVRAQSLRCRTLHIIDSGAVKKLCKLVFCAYLHRGELTDPV